MKIGVSLVWLTKIFKQKISLNGIFIVTQFYVISFISNKAITFEQ